MSSTALVRGHRGSCHRHTPLLGFHVAFCAWISGVFSGHRAHGIEVSVYPGVMLFSADNNCWAPEFPTLISSQSRCSWVFLPVLSSIDVLKAEEEP